MPFADTGKAIGKVTQLLQDHLDNRTGLLVTVGRPEPSRDVESGARLNLFLYEAGFDPSMRDIHLDEGGPTPLWLVLKYLITAFDDNGHSDTVGALENIGEGLRALQEYSFVPLTAGTDADILDALLDNPETLKVSFEHASSELLSKLMQGSDEKYRFSMNFQVRPVMIIPQEPPAYNLLVGIDYTQTPPDVIGEDGIRIDVSASMGPRIVQAKPAVVELNDTFSVTGSGLDAAGLAVHLGPVTVSHEFKPDYRLACTVNGAIGAGTALSAGSHAVTLTHTLANGRLRRSNPVIVHLRPTLTGVATSGLAHFLLPGGSRVVVGTLNLSGFLLGTATDDIMVALYREGRSVKVYDRVTESGDQQSLTLVIEETEGVPEGPYRVILRVNGQQARNSPEIDMVVPP